MIADETWLQKVRTLPPERQREALDFIDFLLQREQTTTSTPDAPSLRGLWADLDVDLDAATIDEARAELWSTFPRTDLL